MDESNPRPTLVPTSADTQHFIQIHARVFE